MTLASRSGRRPASSFRRQSLLNLVALDAAPRRYKMLTRCLSASQLPNPLKGLGTVASIFHDNRSTIGGVIAAESARLHFQGEDELFMQNLVFAYSQNVTRVYERGQKNVYIFVGPTSGETRMARVFGPRTLLATFYSTYGDVCKATH